MKLYERKEQREMREKLASKWAERLGKLDISTAAFCKKNGFNKCVISIIKNGYRVPNERTVEAVEAALKLEKV